MDSNEEEVFSLTHFIYGYIGVRHMIKDHKDNEKGNPLPPHGLLLSNNQQGIFCMHFPIERTVHTTAFDIRVVGHLLGRRKTQWVHQGGSILLPKLLRQVLYQLSYNPPHICINCFQNDKSNYCYIQDIITSIKSVIT